MKKTTIYLIVLTTLLIGILFAGIESYALDAPHDATSAVTVACTNCHPARGATPLWMTQPTTNDVTQMNNQCFQCHVPGVLGTGKYGDIQTHSQYQTRGTNGWVMECRTCHNPHYQKQAITYPGEGYVLQGVVTSATVSMVTVSSPALTPSSLVGEIIVPDINYPNYLYRIVDNTANTITVQTGINGGIATAYVGPNATFGIKFGKMIKDLITTPNSGNKTVKFFEQSGANSFATGTTASTDSICQVCHTQTGSFTNAGLLEGTVSSGGNHPSNVAGTNCTTCHEHKYGFKGGGCDACHGYPPLTASQGSGGLVNVNGGTGATTPGAHGKHVVSSNMTCDECHTGGMTTTIYSSAIEMGFKVGSGTYDGRTSLANGYTYSSGDAGTTITQTGSMTCSVYCHDPGSVGNPSPAWGGSFADGTQCDDCHGGNKTATSAGGGVGPMTTGKHAAHTANADANLGTFACGRCHAGTVTTGNDRAITGTKHTNQVKDVEYDALNSGATANTCNNLYCHSNGKGVSSLLTLATDWYGAGTLDCKGCHGNNGSSQFGEPDYANTGAGQPNANSHTVAAHVSAATDCGKCHANTTTTGTSITGALHINKTIDVTMGANYDQDTNPANNYSAAGKTCSATTCHGGLSPQWGSNTTNATCTKCHGAKTPTASYILNDAAPGAGGTGISTGGATANTDAKVGAHRAHLEATHGYNTGVQCSECHTVPAAWNSAGHLYDGSSDTTKGVAELATLNTGTSALGTGGTPTYAGGQCSNVYCHDSTRFKNAYGGGTNHTPTWSTPFLQGIQADCNTCHGYPPNAPHPSNTNCSGCHPEVNANNVSFADASKHVDGLVEGGGCDGCHGNPPTTSAVGGPDGVATPTTGATNPVSPGAHDKHVNALTGRGIQCDACHNGSAMPNSNTAIDIGFAINGTNFPGFASSAATGTFSGYSSLTNGYTFTTSSPGTQIVPVANQNNTCSSIYCHGGGTTGKAALTGGTNQTPSWVGGASQAACGTCHGGSAFNTASNTPPTTGGHVKHAGSANLGLACNNCHGSTVDMTHVNGSVAWSLNTTDNRFSSAATYSGSASGSTGGLAPSATYGNCTVYCHSIVQKTNGAAMTAVDYKSPNWGTDVGNITCTSCHGAPSASGSHVKHATTAAGDYGFSCDTCHNGDVPPASTVHVNGQINVAINSVYGSAATYNGDTTPGNGFTGSNCSSVYCHSNGTSVATGTIPANTSPVWGTVGPLACSTCHNGTTTGPSYASGLPKANSHQAHVTSAGFACVTCHSATVDAANAVISTTAHDNQQYDVSGAVISSYTFSTAGGSCANTCHGSASTPRWGSNTPAGTDTCTKCHGTETTGTATDAQKAPSSTPNPSGLFVDSSANAVGVHQAHLGSNPYRNPIACTECHKVPTAVNDPGHMDGLPATVTFLYSSLASTHEGVSAPTPTFNYSTLTCSTTYCHDASFIKNGWSAGQAGTVPQPVWSDTTMLNQTTPTATDCGKCHGYPPTGGSHPNPVTDCNSCHSHVAAGSLGFSDISKHMDGIVEGGGCDGCHAFDVAGATNTAGVWSGGTWTNAVARDGIGQGWGAHAQHINHIKTRLGITYVLNPAGQTFGTGDAALVCGVCHTNTASNHTTSGSTTGRLINFGDTHDPGTPNGGAVSPYMFGTNEPNYNGVPGTSSQVTPKTCSNVSCHFKTTPVWSVY